MDKTVRYAFLTSTIAYLLVAIVSVILFATISFWTTLDFASIGRNIENISLKDILSFLTLMLSEFQWWGNFYFLTFLVPWLGSWCILILLVHRFNGGARQRKLLGGLSIFIYYFAMFLSFIIHALIYGWGDIGYQILWLWSVVGFGLGCAAAAISERILKPQIAS